MKRNQIKIDIELNNIKKKKKKRILNNKNYSINKQYK
jgi:ATP-dependent protease HslVU (ClpYQ) ATPase subunit